MAIIHTELFALQRAFFGLALPRSLRFPTQASLASTHTFLLTLLENPYLPSTQYQRTFWKWAIGNLEKESLSAANEDFEIDQRIYDHYLELLSPSGPPPGLSNPNTRDQICARGLPLQQPPTQSYITHHWKLGLTEDEYITVLPTNKENALLEMTVNTSEYHKATLVESRSTVEAGTTGMRTWLASFALSQYLILHPDLVTGKRVLELGSGVGFLAIIVASLQQLSAPVSSEPALWLTDVNEDVLARCRENVSLPCNLASAHPSISYRLLDWFAALEEPPAKAIYSLLLDEVDPDIILGADIMYDPSLIPAVMGVLKIALQTKRGPKSALIALTVRNDNTTELLLHHAKERCLKVEELPMHFDRSMFSESVESREAHGNVKVFRIEFRKDNAPVIA